MGITNKRVGYANQPRRRAQSIMSGRSVLDGSVGNPAYLAWLARATALGANPSAQKKVAITAFLTGLAADGLLAPNQTGANAIYVLVGTNAADSAPNRLNEARVNVVQPGTFDATITSPVGAGNILDAGITGDGTMYWDSGITPSTHYTGRLDDVSIAAAITGSMVSLNVADCGNETSHEIVAKWGDANFYSQLDGQLLTSANASAVAGLYTATSQGGTVRDYIGGTQQQTAARSGTTLPALNLLCFARTQSTGSPGSWSSRQYGLFAFLQGMTAAQVTAFYARVQTLLAGYGVTI